MFNITFKHIYNVEFKNYNNSSISLSRSAYFVFYISSTTKLCILSSLIPWLYAEMNTSI